MKEKSKSQEGGRLSVSEKLGQLAPGFGSRVEEAAATLGSVETAATAIGLGHNQLRRIMAEESVPAFPAIALLARKSGYRFEWLAFNEPPAKAGSVSISSQPPPLMSEEFVYVPELDARSAAGHGVMNDEQPEVRSVLPIPLSMIQAMGLEPEYLRAWEAKGESMTPHIFDGDRLLIYTKEEPLRDGKIYAFNVGEDMLVKQLQLEPDGGVTLVSTNPMFPPRTLRKSERSMISIAGRVVGTFKRFA